MRLRDGEGKMKIEDRSTNDAESNDYATTLKGWHVEAYSGSARISETHSNSRTAFESGTAHARKGWIGVRVYSDERSGGRCECGEANCRLEAFPTDDGYVERWDCNP
jgi:hypothetical protein